MTGQAANTNASIAESAICLRYLPDAHLRFFYGKEESCKQPKSSRIHQTIHYSNRRSLHENKRILGFNNRHRNNFRCVLHHCLGSNSCFGFLGDISCMHWDFALCFFRMESVKQDSADNVLMVVLYGLDCVFPRKAPALSLCWCLCSALSYWPLVSRKNRRRTGLNP